MLCIGKLQRYSLWTAKCFSRSIWNPARSNHACSDMRSLILEDFLRNKAHTANVKQPQRLSEFPPHAALIKETEYSLKNNKKWNPSEVVSVTLHRHLLLVSLPHTCSTPARDGITTECDKTAVVCSGGWCVGICGQISLMCLGYILNDGKAKASGFPIFGDIHFVALDTPGPLKIRTAKRQSAFIATNPTETGNWHEQFLVRE